MGVVGEGCGEVVGVAIRGRCGKMGGRGGGGVAVEGGREADLVLAERLKLPGS